jgi:hypothetical protein
MRVRTIMPAAAGSLILFACIGSATATDQTVPPAPPPPPAQVVSSNARDVAVAACMNEAKAQAAKKGATDVRLREVEDTDKKSNSRAAVRALVNVIYTDKNGKEKKKKRTFKCQTQNGVVTSFKYY